MASPGWDTGTDPVGRPGSAGLRSTSGPLATDPEFWSEERSLEWERKVLPTPPPIVRPTEAVSSLPGPSPTGQTGAYPGMNGAAPYPSDGGVGGVYPRLGPVENFHTDLSVPPPATDGVYSPHLRATPYDPELYALRSAPPPYEAGPSVPPFVYQNMDAAGQAGTSHLPFGPADTVNGRSGPENKAGQWSAINPLFDNGTGGARHSVIEINEEPPPVPEESDGTPDSAWRENIVTRHAFIRKVYFILLFQLALTVAFCAVLLLNDASRTWVQQNFGMMIGVMVSSFVVLIALFCVRKRVPYNYLLLVLFTLLMSYSIGVIGIIYAFLPFNTVAEYFYASIGALLFSAYIMYDTYMIVNRLSEEEYILGAIDL